MPMKKVEHITESEEGNLKAIKKHHIKYRERAMRIILSYKGYSPKEIGEYIRYIRSKHIAQKNQSSLSVRHCVVHLDQYLKS